MLICCPPKLFHSTRLTLRSLPCVKNVIHRRAWHNNIRQNWQYRLFLFSHFSFSKLFSSIIFKYHKQAYCVSTSKAGPMSIPLKVEIWLWQLPLIGTTTKHRFLNKPEWLTYNFTSNLLNSRNVSSTGIPFNLGPEKPVFMFLYWVSVLALTLMFMTMLGCGSRTLNGWWMNGPSTSSSEPFNWPSDSLVELISPSFCEIFLQKSVQHRCFSICCCILTCGSEWDMSGLCQELIHAENYSGIYLFR